MQQSSRYGVFQVSHYLAIIIRLPSIYCYTYLLFKSRKSVLLFFHEKRISKKNTFLSLKMSALRSYTIVVVGYTSSITKVV